jgi:hypothetical protein
MAVKQRTTYKPLMNTAGVSNYLKGKTPTQTYSFRQLEELWIGAGGSRVEAAYAAAIALAESKGNPNAEGHNTNGTVDRGLWQINSVHGKLSTTDVAANAKAAVQIAKESGFGPWVTYKTGAYKAYLTPKNLLSGVKQNEAIEPLAGPAGTEEPKGVEAVEKGEEKAGKAVAKAFKFSWGDLFQFAVKLVLVLAGAVLVVYGIMVAVRPRESALSLPKVVPVPV